MALFISFWRIAAHQGPLETGLNQPKDMKQKGI
jgi:hypothetical protein